MGSEITRRELGKAGLAAVALAGLSGLSGCGQGRETGGPEGKQAAIQGLPDLGIPKPVDYLRTSWSRDPLALCSYSYLAPKVMGSEVRSMLAEPVGRIVFAGEATARIPATVHGAIQAGESAARLLARQLATGTRVAIIGAGAAGLACAGALARDGLEPVLLEASDQIGGRVKSGWLSGKQVELGASWIHGVDGNPLVELAGDAGIELIPHDYDFDFPQPGQEKLVRNGSRVYRRAIDSFKPGLAGASELTVADLLPARQGPGLRWAAEVETAQEYGADPSELAALATWEGEWLAGGDALPVTPFLEIIRGLSAGVSPRLGFEVRRIAQDKGGVVLTGDRSDGNREEIEAAAAVVTVPIGVLKAGRIEFEPELPLRTRAAIRGLGAGLLDKVWLSFEEPFWDRSAEGFSWINPRRPGRWGFWLNSVPVSGDPFLMTLSGGTDARQMANRSDSEVCADVYAALAEMFG